jgi:hypothetical protein
MDGEARSQPAKSTPHGPEGHTGGGSGQTVTWLGPSNALVHLDPLLPEAISGLDIEGFQHLGVGHP